MSVGGFWVWVVFVLNTTDFDALGVRRTAVRVGGSGTAPLSHDGVPNKDHGHRAAQTASGSGLWDWDYKTEGRSYVAYTTKYILCVFYMYDIVCIVH